MKATKGIQVGGTVRRTTDGQFYKIIDIIDETDKSWLVEARRLSWNGAEPIIQFRIRKSTKLENQ